MSGTPQNIDQNLPPPLKDLLYRFCDVNAPELIHRLAAKIKSGSLPDGEVEALKESLMLAIKGEILTPSQYKSITGDNECITKEDLQIRMREIWSDLFPDASF